MMCYSEPFSEMSVSRYDFMVSRVDHEAGPGNHPVAEHELRFTLVDRVSWSRAGHAMIKSMYDAGNFGLPMTSSKGVTECGTMAEKAEWLEEALALALRLSPADRLKLVERVVSSVEREMLVGEVSTGGGRSNRASSTWGAEVVALLDRLDLTDWERMDIPDVGEWVRQLRRQESERHEQYWKGEE